MRYFAMTINVQTDKKLLNPNLNDLTKTDKLLAIFFVIRIIFDSLITLDIPVNRLLVSSSTICHLLNQLLKSRGQSLLLCLAQAKVKRLKDHHTQRFDQLPQKNTTSHHKMIYLILVSNCNQTFMKHYSVIQRHSQPNSATPDRAAQETFNSNTSPLSGASNAVHSPKPMMHIAYFPLFPQNFSIPPIFVQLTFFD